MRKFNITIAAVSTVINASEYSIFPKTNLFKTVEGHDAASTSGKGKSAVNNHYLYFKDEAGKMFYFKSDAATLAAARATGFSVTPVGMEVEAPVAADEPAVETPAPAPKRVSKRKATA